MEIGVAPDGALVRHGQCVSRLRRVIHVVHVVWRHRSVAGDLLLEFPLFYGQAAPLNL